MKLLFNSALFFEKIMNGEVRFAHQLLERADNAGKDTIDKMKNEAFLKLVTQVFENSHYYKDVLLEHGYNLNSFRDISDIKKFPLLTKDIIKNSREKLLCANIPASDCITRNSGGTTGEPIKMEINKQARINDLYFYYRGLNWMGYSPGQPMVKFFGGSLGGNNSPTLKNRIKKWVSNEVFMPAFSLDKDNASHYLDTVKAKGKTHLQGYVSTLYSLAVYAKELNYKGLKIRGVFTTAEQLPAEQAAFISEVFKCDVKGFFGCAEVNCLGFQKEMGGSYIVPDEIVHIETIKEPITGMDNSFLLTSLYNYRTPLIRYLNGDTGILKQGKKYTEIEELSGRSADMFIKADGSFISSILATQTMQITGLTHKIKKYQLWQTGRAKVEIIYLPFNDMDDLTLAEQVKITAMYRKRLGEEFDVSIRRSGDFVTSISGKHRLMVNKLQVFT